MRDMLALKTAEELGMIALPADKDMAPIRRDTTSAAGNLLDAFESELLLNKIRALIIRDVRRELLKRTRISKFLELGIALATLVAALLVAGAQFLSSNPPDIQSLHLLNWMSIEVLVFLLVCQSYLRFIDRD